MSERKRRDKSEKIYTDKEFEDANVSMESDTYIDLLKSMKEHGFKEHEPIFTWVHGGKEWVVDGHHRNKARKELNIDFYTEEVEELKGKPKAEVKAWITDKQLSTKTVSPLKEMYLQGLRYESQKNTHGGDRKSNPTVEGLRNTAQILGKKYGKSDKYFEKAGKIIKAIRKIAGSTGRKANDCLNILETITNVELIVRLKPEDQKDVFDRFEADNNTESIGDLIKQYTPAPVPKNNSNAKKPREDTKTTGITGTTTQVTTIISGQHDPTGTTGTTEELGTNDTKVSAPVNNPTGGAVTGIQPVTEETQGTQGTQDTQEVQKKPVHTGEPEWRDANPYEDPDYGLFQLVQWYRHKFGGELAQVIYEAVMSFSNSARFVEYCHSEDYLHDQGVTFESEIDEVLARLKDLIMSFEGFPEEEDEEEPEQVEKPATVLIATKEDAIREVLKVIGNDGSTMDEIIHQLKDVLGVDIVIYIVKLLLDTNKLDYYSDKYHKVQLEESGTVEASVSPVEAETEEVKAKDSKPAKKVAKKSPKAEATATEKRDFTKDKEIIPKLIMEAEWEGITFTELMVGTGRKADYDTADANGKRSIESQYNKFLTRQGYISVGSGKNTRYYHSNYAPKQFDHIIPDSELEVVSQAISGSGSTAEEVLQECFAHTVTCNVMEALDVLEKIGKVAKRTIDGEAMYFHTGATA